MVRRITVLTGWCWIVAAVLLISFAVHASTFLGIAPMAKGPGLLIFIIITVLPWFPAAWYTWRAGVKGTKPKDRFDKNAPRWLRILLCVIFVYALVNGAIFFFLGEGGSPQERDGKYLLTFHGRILRKLSEAEYHQLRVYEDRMMSSACMMMPCATLITLVGMLRLRLRAREHRLRRWNHRQHKTPRTENNF